MTEDKKDTNLEVVGDDNKSKTKEVAEGKDVTMKQTEFEALMDRINRLEAAGDKKQLARYDSAHRDEEESVVKLLELDGKIIKSWGKMKDNFVEKNEQGWWKEDQKIEITFMDDTKKEYDYLYFSKNYIKIPAKIIKENKEEKKIRDYKGQVVNRYLEVIFEVETLKDNKAYKVNSLFVN